MFSLKENRASNNIRPPYSSSNDLCSKIVRFFKEGEDEKAISLWKTINYSPLPVEDASKFYSLALNLKDIQLLDLENNFHSNRSNDRTIAAENQKLKAEVRNLAEAIDQIMRENDEKKHEEFNQGNEVI